MRKGEPWRERSRPCLAAAKLLLESGLLRDSISRAYYAAYCAATSALVSRGPTFACGWRNPTHEQLPELVSNNMGFGPGGRVRLNRLLRFLRQSRENADYRPDSFADPSLARNCIHSAIEVMRVMEVEERGTWLD